VTVRILNGNVVEVREDLRFASPNTLGLVLGTGYNSRSALFGSLGHGWTHTYEASLSPSVSIEGQTYLKIVDGTGRAAYFQEQTPGLYRGAFNEPSQVKAEGGGYVWYRLDGSRFGFSSSGLLLWLEDERGNRLDLTYDAQNRPITATDLASGRSLSFHYNADGRLESVSGPVTAAGSRPAPG
jgi:YD repeat-containing protein